MADAIKAVLTKLITSVPVLLIVLGVVLFALGAARGVTHDNWLPIPDLPARIVMVVAGVVVFALGVRMSTTTTPGVPDASLYGVAITHPRENDTVQVVDVRGTFRKPPPADYALRVIRIYPQHGHFIPVGGVARIDLKNQTWEVPGCEIAGKIGDRRQLAAYLVGPGGTALLEYYSEATDAHNRARRDLIQSGRKDPVLDVNYISPPHCVA